MNGHEKAQEAQKGAVIGRELFTKMAMVLTHTRDEH
jgi:hypothetical protein